MPLSDALGLLASVISFVLFLPQAVSTWQHRRDPRAMAALSIWTQLLIICNATTWFAYAALTSAFWVGAPGFVNLPLAIVTLSLILRARRKKPAPDCELCERGVEHNVFITAPPGRGDIAPCSPVTRQHGIVVIDRTAVGASAPHE